MHYMTPLALIRQLRGSTRWAIVCPDCQCSIPSSRADLFTAENLSRRALEFRRDLLEDINSLRAEIAELKTKKLEHLSKAVRAVNLGVLIEKFAPILEGFHCDPAECHGVFDPIDYIVFHGQLKGEIERIEFIDVKSGRARLSATQSHAKKALEAGRLSFSHIGVKP